MNIVHKLHANTAIGVLYQILRSFHYRDKYVIKSLYVQYVRPHLEFWSPAWSPWLLGDINKLESVQEKFVKSVSKVPHIRQD